ncbi:YphA family membrane protein [Gracilibacillus sp. D59]|uniref:YphA family membrane protein n=1 Tax=Gracilibacillus sp. D59 TaxID=3457434 RepID=UPI003FCD20C3
MSMYQYLTIYICWVLWCFVTFFMSKHGKRNTYSILLLLFLILLPYKIIVMDLPLNVSFFLLLLYSFFSIVNSKLSFKKYFSILIISYLYAIYFIWRITSPILNDFSFIIIAVISGFLLVQIASRSTYQQITILIAGVSFGHFFYSLICRSYYLQYTINDTHFFSILFSILLLIAIQHSWEFLITKIENVVKMLEFKKRWNS